MTEEVEVLDQSVESLETPESAPEQTTTAETAEHADEHKVSKGVQKRIDRLTREKYRLQGELEAMRRQPAQQSQPSSQTQDAQPKPEQFSSYEDFLDAKAEWKAERKVAQVLAEREASSRRHSEEAEHEDVRRKWDSGVVSALQAYDDFEDVALNPEIPITQSMADAIQRADKGADVLYYLGKNKAEATRISKLDKTSQAIAIGRLEATIAKPAAKKATDAPEPIQPVGTRASASKDPENMNTFEWMVWRNSQISAKRKR